MKPLASWERIIERKRYSVETAELVADDCYWDGHNFERHGRQTWLYKTPSGAFFTVTRTQWQGEEDSLIPISEGEAIELYEGRLSEHHVDYELAFPDVVVEDA